MYMRTHTHEPLRTWPVHDLLMPADTFLRAVPCAGLLPLPIIASSVGPITLSDVANLAVGAARSQAASPATAPTPVESATALVKEDLLNSRASWGTVSQQQQQQQMMDASQQHQTKPYLAEGPALQQQQQQQHLHQDDDDDESYR